MASFEVVNGVGVITCQNPPVNQLSYRLRVGLFDGLHKSLSDPNVKSILIVCDGRSFIAGADIKEFSTGMGFKKPLPAFIKECEASTKPVVAAIHGTALGGGLEVALACHYRIGTSRCKVGLPEVLIGLLPGAGGTQRLPRLVGPMLAAEMIVSGMHMKAQRAYDIGILDKLIPILDNHKLDMERLILRQEGIRYAQAIADKPFENRRISKQQCPKLNDFFYDIIYKQTQKRARGFIAPKLCLEAVKAAHTSKTFEEGLKKERSLFLKLATGSQAPALQHIFFAQRQITKVPGINPKSAKKLNSVGIIGCGTMGGGILMNFVQVGIPVVVLEIKQQFLDRGMSVVMSNWQRKVKKGSLTKKKLESYLKLIKTTTDYNDLRDVDLVIEAVFEKLSIKEEVFRNLDRVCKPDCILASNTSFLPIEKIAKVTSRPNKVVGTHFFAPANVMQLLENVRHDRTDDVTIATVQKMAKTIKKKGVLVKSCDGFVGNRMFAIEGIEANRLVLEGSSPDFVDKCLYDYGWAMGIFAVGDLSGNDIGYKSRKDRGILDNKPEYYPYEVSDKLVEMGRLGLKVGKGWYDYKGRSRKPIVSKVTLNIINDVRRNNGIQARYITKEEVIERCMYPMVNEGLKILEEGVALRPSDIDVVFVFGYGYPAYRGGIMYWADKVVGLKKIRDRLNYYNKKYGKSTDRHLKPCKLLNYLVDNKLKLTKYWKKRSKQSKL